MNGGSCQFARFTTDSRGGGKPSIGASLGHAAHLISGRRRESHQQPAIHSPESLRPAGAHRRAVFSDAPTLNDWERSRVRVVPVITGTVDDGG
jgi:hypothetical protein